MLHLSFCTLSLVENYAKNPCLGYYSIRQIFSKISFEISRIASSIIRKGLFFFFLYCNLNVLRIFAD